MKNILLFTLLFCFTKTKAQYALAGVHGSIYVDIVPDTAIIATHNFTGTVGNAYYYLDINQDGTPDIKFTSYYYIAFAGVWAELSASSLDTSSTSFSLNKAFNALDTIASTTTYTTSGDLYYSYYSQPSGVNQSNLPWGDSTNQFIGVKYKTTSGILYGWIKVSVTAENLLIQEFSLGNPLTDINQLSNTNTLNIYPNPAQNNFTVEVSSNQKQQLQVVDISGKQVLQQTISGTTIIDANQLESGVYFIQLKNSTGVSTQKIIVQH